MTHDWIKKDEFDEMIEEMDIEVLTEVLAAATPVEPPPSLRGRLLSRAAQSPQEPGILLQRDGLLISRPEELEWSTLAPGVEYRLLFSDPVRKYNSLLVRMEAGAKYPPHKHTDIEELFLLSGLLNVGGTVMYPGDYCRGEIDSVHGETSTDTGCTFVLLASQENEVYA